MPGLPPEIFLAIVDELDVATADDRKALHSLLFVSKQVNAFALRAIYQDILLCQDRDQQFTQWHAQFLRLLCSLSRDIEHNPGLRFTATFSCLTTLAFKHTEAAAQSKEINSVLGSIIPFLVNVRRVTISLHGGFADPRILRSLPLSAPLSHLKILECGMGSEDLRDFLASRPTLKWLKIYASGRIRTVERDRPTLHADALLRLLSLSIDTADIMFFENPLTSLVNLNLTNVGSVPPMTDAGVVRRMAPFASITSCRLDRVYHFNVSMIITSLPLLEYLWVETTPLVDGEAEYRALSATKLRYLRCYDSFETARAFGRRMFDTVKTLVVVDITAHFSQDTIRMCHGDYQGPVFYQSDKWTRWWEHAKRAVELAAVMGSQRKQRKAPLDADPKPDTADDAQRELYLAEISHLRTRLLTTLDALDALRTQHAYELHALTEERIRYHQQAKVYEQLWREAEAEKADMRDAVCELVEKVEQCNDYSQWPYSRLRIARYAAPTLPSSSSAPMASLASPMVSSAHPNPYEASLITALRRDLHAEKSAHEDTRHRLTLHISTLEAQLAFREAELEGCAARIGAALGTVHRQSVDTNGNVNQPRAMSSGGIVHNDYSTPDAVLRVLDAARAKSRSLEQDIKDISAKLERSRLSASISTTNASLRASVPESRSKAVQTEHPPARELRRHGAEAGDVFEDALRIIEEKLDRSQADIDVDLTKSAVQTISIQHPMAAMREDAVGLHPGDEETDEDATLRPTPLVLPVSRAAAAAAVSHAPTVPPCQAVVTPTVQCPPPPPASPSLNSTQAEQEDELPAATDTGGGEGPHSHLVEEFEKEVDALGRGVDALRTESGALLNGRRAVGACHSPLRSPSHSYGPPHQHEHEREERLALDLLAPDDDYGEISMELATPLNPTVTLPPLPPLPPSPPLPPLPPLPPSSPHTVLLAALPPLPLSPWPPLLTSSPPSAPHSPVPSMLPSPLTVLLDTVISVSSTGMAPSQISPSIASPSERTPGPLIPIQAPPIRLASPLLPSTSPPPSPPLRPIATPPRTEAPLTSVFQSPWLTPSFERSPNHSTELDDLQDRHLSGIPSIPGLPPLPAIRRDLGLGYPYDSHREAGSSPSRSISPLRLSPYLATAAPDTREVIDELGRDSPAPASSPFASPQRALSSLPSTPNASPLLYPEAEYTLQHLQRVEAELRETREALEADEAERVALQGVLDGLVREVVGAGYGILGADEGGGGVGQAQE